MSEIKYFRIRIHRDNIFEFSCKKKLLLIFLIRLNLKKQISYSEEKREETQEKTQVHKIKSEAYHNTLSKPPKNHILVT